MSEPDKYAVGQTVEHKDTKRRAQIVSLDKGCMQFRPFFEAFGDEPAHLAEPNCIESCSEWDIVEPPKVESIISEKTMLSEKTIEISGERFLANKPAPRVPRRT